METDITPLGVICIIIVAILLALCIEYLKT